jgi:hypothetical protein
MIKLKDALKYGYVHIKNKNIQLCAGLNEFRDRSTKERGIQIDLIRTKYIFSKRGRDYLLKKSHGCTSSLLYVNCEKRYILKTLHQLLLELSIEKKSYFEEIKYEN